MTPAAFYSLVLKPNAAALGLSSPVTNSKQARVLLMAIAGHESAWGARIQVPGGEARGYWQCQLDGAVTSVMSDPITGPLASAFCAARDIPSDAATVFEAIAWHDALAYVIARLALWQDPAALPAVGDASGAMSYYSNVWRPGVIRAPSWAATYQQALTLVS